MVPLPALEEEHYLEQRNLIRSELNIERWPLFTTSRFKGKSREYMRQEIEGDTVKTRKVIIGRLADREVGVLRIFDLKCLYALIKLWEQSGRPEGRPVSFALHEIARILKLSWGGKTYREIKEALLRLRGLPISWINSFYRKDLDTTEELLELFNILSELKIYERRQGSKLKASYSQFRFNERLLLNLLNNYTKPIYLNVILNFKKEVSILLYLHLDLVMADKTCYVRRADELIRDLDLGGDYSYPSYKRRILEPALNELEGVELSTGRLIYAKLQKLHGGQDWKGVFKKRPYTLKGQAKKMPEKDSFEVLGIVKDILAITGDERSRGFYTKLAKLALAKPKLRDLIYRCLSEVKEEWHQGLIRKTKGAVFTDKIKRYCKERGIDLGLKSGSS